jgi:hypothetical protein
VANFTGRKTEDRGQMAEVGSRNAEVGIFRLRISDFRFRIAASSLDQIKKKELVQRKAERLLKK